MDYRPSCVTLTLQELLKAKVIAVQQCPCCLEKGLLARCELPALVRFFMPRAAAFRCLNCQKVLRHSHP